MKDHFDKRNDVYSVEEIQLLENCTLCPRECRINRFENAGGYCRTGAGFEVASVSVHKGEEPVVCGKNGICNIFFTGCNLRCVFCQNIQISHPESKPPWPVKDLNTLLDSVETILSEGITSVGFVSPSHVVPQVKAIIRGLQQRGLHPVTVYNTNGYDKRETVKSLDGIMDVYLPDYKYVTKRVSSRYSDADDYPEVAIKAIKEMYYQKGSGLITDSDGQIQSGLIIRHLVLPGYAEESKMVLQKIAEEISPGVHLSLMSQYHPSGDLKHFPEINRTLYSEEYNSVVEEMQKLGFRNGWVQEMDSHGSYLPDFKSENPFQE